MSSHLSHIGPMGNAGSSCAIDRKTTITHPNYFGGCRPGELAQSSIWAAVVACRAFFRSSSRSPAAADFAFSRASTANAISRSLNDIVCLKRRRICMACFFPSEEGGSAIGVLITDVSHDPFGDEISVRAYDGDASPLFAASGGTMRKRLKMLRQCRESLWSLWYLGTSRFAGARLACNRTLDLGGQHLVVLGEPAEQFAFLGIGCQIADDFALGDLHAQLLEMRLHVLHDEAHLFRGLLRRRIGPVVQVGGGFGLTDFLKRQFALRTRRQEVRLLPFFFAECLQSFLKR